MIRRLVVAAAVGAAAFGSFSPASATTEPPCYGAYAGGYEVGHCAGIVCNDLCYWRSYPVCAQPDDSQLDLCALYTALLPPIG